MRTARRSTSRIGSLRASGLPELRWFMAILFGGEAIALLLRAVEADREHRAAALIAVPTLYLAARAATRGEYLVGALASLGGVMVSLWLGYERFSSSQLLLLMLAANFAAGVLAEALGTLLRSLSGAVARARVFRERDEGYCALGRCNAALAALGAGWCAGESFSGWMKWDGLELLPLIAMLFVPLLLVHRRRPLAAAGSAPLLLVGLGLAAWYLRLGPEYSNGTCLLHATAELLVAHGALAVVALPLGGGLLLPAALRWAVVSSRRANVRLRRGFSTRTVIASARATVLERPEPEVSTEAAPQRGAPGTRARAGR